MRMKGILAAGLAVAGLEVYNRSVTLPQAVLEPQLPAMPTMWQWRFGNVAVYEAGTLRQIGSLATRKAPMGFGFAADGKHAFVCCHDAASVTEFALSTGRVTREFSTAGGCEFIISYQ